MLHGSEPSSEGTHPLVKRPAYAAIQCQLRFSTHLTFVQVNMEDLDAFADALCMTRFFYRGGFLPAILCCIS